MEISYIRDLILYSRVIDRNDKFSYHSFPKGLQV